MPGKNKVEIIIEAVDMAGKVFRDVSRESSRAFHAMSSEAEKLKRRLTGLHGAFLTLAGGYGITRLAKSFLDTAVSFEQMQLKLDALTGGRGKETLEALNKWALEMPVNTEKVIDTFVMMKAMGLDPTRKSLETLINVAVIFGEDAMPRVARALGQMKTLGKLSAEELNQLAEVGIDARKYLRDAFGMSVQEIQQAGISIDRVIQAIAQGLERDFGGAARSAMNNWQGLIAAFQSYITEIEREVMEAGVFEELKKELKAINDELAHWLENNRELIRQKVPEYVEETKDALKQIWNIISYDPAILDYGLIGLALAGRKGAVLLGGLAHLENVIKYQMKAIDLWKKGVIDFKEFATSNFKELKALVDKAEKRYGATGPMIFEITEEVREQAKKKAKSDLKDRAKATMYGLEKGGGVPSHDEYSRALAAYETLHAQVMENIKRLTLDATEFQIWQLDRWYEHAKEVYRKANKDTAELEELYTRKREAILDEQIDKFAEAYAKDVRSIKESTNEMNQFAIQAARNMQDAFSDFFFDVMQGKFDNLVDSFKATIDRMVAEALASKLSSALFGDFGESGKLGGLVGSALSWVTGIFGFAEGGIITEPIFGIGASGRRYLFGERGPEEIRPVKASKNQNITINMYIQTQDARSFELSRARIAGQMAAAIARSTS